MSPNQRRLAGDRSEKGHSGISHMQADHPSQLLETNRGEVTPAHQFIKPTRTSWCQLYVIS